VTTGDAAVQNQSCPNPTITHIADDFSPGDRVYFTTYYRDLLSSQVSQYTIYRPDDSIFQSWTYSSSSPYSGAPYRWWSYPLTSDAVTGTWRFEVLYESQTYMTFFNVGDPVYITVTSPNAGDDWMPGLVHDIAWNDNLGGDVRLELLQGDVYLFTIAKATPSDGLFSWAIPAGTPAGAAYRIRIIDLANDTFYADSASFTLGIPLTVYLPIVLKNH
jgi:hypothetical protein